MADGDISLLAIYDRIAGVDKNVAGVDKKVGELAARVDEQLAHGASQLSDHEMRLRSLEATRERGNGRSTLMSHVATFLGSSAAATVLSYWLEHRP